MKKLLYIFVFMIIVISFVVINVNAYSCVYDFDYEQGLFGWNKESDKVEFIIDPTNKTISYPDGFFDKKVYFLDYYVNSKYTIEHIVDSLDGGCVGKVQIGGISYDDGVYAYAIFFEESNFYQLKTKEILFQTYYMLPTIKIGNENIWGQIGEDQVATGFYNKDESDGPVSQVNFGCEYFDSTFGRLKELKCRKKDVSCSLGEVQEYNNHRDSLRLFCNSVTKNATFGLSSCLDSCLSLNKSLAEYEDINTISDCGFSEKLIQFIANIVKWVKYIIPVIVIVLGILDFIKAISADKDDEMKKAQGRFVKRLIAAALIFIIPFIIEFVLDKMGFGANGCGIIDL